MTDGDQTVMYTVNGDRGHPSRIFPFGDFPVQEEQPADLATGLVSLGFIGAAIRRSLRFLCVLAVIGLLVGVGYFKKSPPAYKASTSVLLTYSATENPASAIFDNQTIAESHSVAKLAMAKLGLPQQDLGRFAAEYTVSVVTDRILLITASAPASTAAVDHARAIANAFLQFRASQEKTAQQVLISSLQRELSQARENVSNYASEVSQLQAQPSTPDQQAKLKTAQGQHEQAQVALSVLEQTIAGDEAGSSTLSAVTGSIVLDPAAPLAHSKTKSMITYAAYGLIGGLAIGIGIVAVRAITSDRLRRRDDIARALGAPVRLSVGPVRLSRRLPPSRRGLEARGDVPVRRIVAHLRDVASSQERRTALVVVAVDDPEVAAVVLVSLAMTCAEEGRKVLLADLASGAPAAALLGSKEPGVRMVDADNARLMLAVPPADEIAPPGPLRVPAEARRTEFSEEVADRYSSADTLLTLMTLDPALGADQLPTWAPNVVALVTAGRSSWTRVQAAGELIRSAGSSVTSTVLVGSDKSDETLGVVAGDDALLRVGRSG